MPELVFKGKEFVYNHHLTVPYRPLVPDAAKSFGDGQLDDNLVIHGDNLHALKALLPRYEGRIDCIYIDPPYNTGEQTWAYNDNVESQQMKDWLKENPVNVDDMLRHDKWCCMMWPRITLLKQLLKEDGVLFVSINDIEAPRLRLMLDEILGEDRFVSQLVWKSRQNKDNRNKSGVSVDHEYILCYGRKLKGDERNLAGYSNPDNDERLEWTSGNMVGLASISERPFLHYCIIDPETGIGYDCPKQGWRYEARRMVEMIKEKRILWPSSPEGRPREKSFLSELEGEPNTSSVIGTGLYTQTGTEELDAMFQDRRFKFPKPSGLIAWVVAQACPKDGIILDSFAGSGTTAHAVLKLNHLDGSSRKFILIEGEDYANTLTAERVRKAINGYSFTGASRDTLLEKQLTLKDLQNGATLIDKAKALQNTYQGNYEQVQVQLKEGKLTVTGTNNVKERMSGLGGSFTFCTLGDPLDVDNLLQSKNLPSREAMGAVLFHNATGESLPSNVQSLDIPVGEWYLGESSAYHVWLIYRPDDKFLKSKKAALTLELAQKIGNSTKDKKHLVFAPSRYVSNKQILPLGVEYAPLPFALYSLEKD